MRFADNRKIFAEDMYFSLCYCAHAEKIVCLKDCLYNYRQRKDSIMGQQVGRNNAGRIHLLAGAVAEHYGKWDDCSLLLADFSLIHFQILMNQLIFQMLNVPSIEDFRQALVTEEAKWPEMEAVIRSQLENRKKWKRYYAAYRYYEMVETARFLLEGNGARWRLAGAAGTESAGAFGHFKRIIRSERGEDNAEGQCDCAGL